MLLFMDIRFGYVSTALNLWNTTPSKTITFTRWSGLSPDEQTNKLLTITKQNIETTKRILHYNIAHEITVYRFSSSIVPLATHPDVRWDYITPFKQDWAEIGELVNKHSLRVSFHPNAFTLFTSPNQDVTNKAVEDMVYHYQLLEAMGMPEHALINIHVGGSYGDKQKAIQRFHTNSKKIPTDIKKCMTLENDDKTYTTEETLQVCEYEDIPLLFDYHHHIANPSDSSLEELFPRILRTWDKRGWKPKIHISSPRSEKEIRAHASNVDVDFIMPFIQLLKKTGIAEIDFIIEAKNKDIAMMKLIEDLSSLRGINRLTGGSIRIK